MNYMNGSERKETKEAMDGYSVRVTPDKYKQSIVLTLHKEKRLWICSEASTGRMIQDGETRKEAVEKSLEKLEFSGEKVFRKEVAKCNKVNRVYAV